MLGHTRRRPYNIVDQRERERRQQILIDCFAIFDARSGSTRKDYRRSPLIGLIFQLKVISQIALIKRDLLAVIAKVYGSYLEAS